MENNNITDIIPEDEESMAGKFGKGVGEFTAKAVPAIADATEETARGIVKGIPKLGTFIIDTIVNGADIAGDVAANLADFTSGVYAGYKNDKELRETGKKGNYKGSSFANKEGFLDRLNATSDKATTAIDKAVDEFMDRPEFNQFHKLDDTLMKEILNFAGESVSYFVGGRWITLPTKLVFANKNSAQVKTLMNVIAKNKKLANTKGLTPTVKKIASTKAKEAKTMLDGFLKTGKIALKDPAKGITAGNIISKGVGDSKFINQLVATYDKAFNTGVAVVKSGIGKHKLATGIGAAVIGSAGGAKNMKGEESEEVTEEKGALGEEKSTWESFVEGAGDLWDSVNEQVDTALQGNIYWDKTKEFFRDATDMSQEFLGEIKTKFSEMTEGEQNIISEKLEEGNSAEAMNVLKSGGFNFRTNIELPWLLEGETPVFYNWLEGNIWAMRDGDKKTLEENIQSYNDAELAEGNMQDYVVTYYE